MKYSIPMLIGFVSGILNSVLGFNASHWQYWTILMFGLSSWALGRLRVKE